MYKIIALMGEAGAGKDTIFQSVLRHFENDERVHEIVSCTSRPIRENETNGKNYHFYTAS
jgi:guanylate kinase